MEFIAEPPGDTPMTWVAPPPEQRQNDLQFSEQNTVFDHSKSAMQRKMDNGHANEAIKSGQSVQKSSDKKGDDRRTLWSDSDEWFNEAIGNMEAGWDHGIWSDE